MERIFPPSLLTLEGFVELSWNGILLVSIDFPGFYGFLNRFSLYGFYRIVFEVSFFA